MFSKIGVPKKFAKFTGKHLFQASFLLIGDSRTDAFNWGIASEEV